MNTLTYNIPNDINTYIMTCSDNMVRKYYNLLRENGAYNIMLNNEVIYFDKQKL